MKIKINDRKKEWKTLTNLFLRLFTSSDINIYINNHNAFLSYFKVFLLYKNLVELHTDCTSIRALKRLTQKSSLHHHSSSCLKCIHLLSIGKKSTLENKCGSLSRMKEDIHFQTRKIFQFFSSSFYCFVWVIWQKNCPDFVSFEIPVKKKKKTESSFFVTQHDKSSPVSQKTQLVKLLQKSQNVHKI